jgi:phytol kinase
MPIWVGGIGVLIMGWGDGLASVVGERAGRQFRVWGGRKSLAGSAAMFAASLVVCLVFTLLFGRRLSGSLPILAAAAATAALAAGVELLTPFGLDNLTVPLLSSLFYLGVFA